MRHAKVIKLESGEKYKRLLNKDLGTFGMRSGLVRLKPGEDIGKHTTAEREEIILVLKGKGDAIIEGDVLKIENNSIVYIPPETSHDIKNTGPEMLEYVFITSKREH